MAHALFETFNIRAYELFSSSFLFCFESYDERNLFICILTSEEEAAASKRLVLLKFYFGALEQSFNLWRKN